MMIAVEMTVPVVIDMHDERTRFVNETMIPQRDTRYKKQSQQCDSVAAAVAGAVSQHAKLAAARQGPECPRSHADLNVFLLAQKQAHDGLTEHGVEDVPFGKEPRE